MVNHDIPKDLQAMAFKEMVRKTGNEAIRKLNEYIPEQETVQHFWLIYRMILGKCTLM
jgi:hypothetical protein